MNPRDLSLRKLATILGVSQPFLSQIQSGKRPMPDSLKEKVEALGAYHLLITDKQPAGDSTFNGGSQIRIVASQAGFEPATRCLEDK